MPMCEQCVGEGGTHLDSAPRSSSGPACTPCCAGRVLCGLRDQRSLWAPSFHHKWWATSWPEPRPSSAQPGPDSATNSMNPDMENFLSSQHNSQRPKWSLGGLEDRREGGTAPGTTLELCCNPQGGSFILLRPGHLKDTGAKARHGNLEG